MTPIETSWPWLAILLLGVWHGLNPAMGWLFAVALGLQEKSGRAVWRALLPLAVGHGLAIALAILLAVLLGRVASLESLKWPIALVLLGFGLYRLVRSRHPRWGGMQVGMRDLTVWSFLMASAHGAGLMVLPFFLGTVRGPAAHEVAVTTVAHGAAAGSGGYATHAAALVSSLPSDQLVGLAVTAVHTLGYLLVAALIAVVVYEKLGLRLLRTIWVNLDLVWAVALIATAIITPLI